MTHDRTKPAQLSAAEVHGRLEAALRELQKAEQGAVTWFAEIVRRRLYRELGFATAKQYAIEKLGFTPNRFYQFMDLAGSLEALPEVRRALEQGEIGWTVAREVSKVATPETEEQWLAEAKAGGRQRLRRKIAEARQRTRQEARGEAAGPELALGGGRGEEGAAAGPQAPAAPAPPPAAPVTTSLRLDPEQYRRLEAGLEAVRKRPRLRAARLSREEILLRALEGMLAADQELDGRAPERSGPSSSSSAAAVEAASAGEAEAAELRRRNSEEAGPDGVEAAGPAAASPSSSFRPRSSPYQIVVFRCEKCGGGHVMGPDGQLRELRRAAMERIACDAIEIDRQGHAHATIPPSIRRQVLARDGKCCRVCGSDDFVHVHHIKPVSRGGTNELENLVTLCFACHDYVHERGGALPPLRPVKEARPEARPQSRPGSSTRPSQGPRARPGPPRG